ncbi:hypothetical protein X564_19440 [Pseudoalteromonas agarivorans]|jgi:hypothetical protein|nr:hypothetical protein X564_19440 [Pseudoalteromonas agarivorans]
MLNYIINIQWFIFIDCSLCRYWKIMLTLLKLKIKRFLVDVSVNVSIV